MSTFFERLKEERARLGLNQTQMAALGEVTKHSQLNYEAGTRKPDSAYLEAAARHGLDVLYVITGQRSAPVSPTDPGEQVLLAAYRAAPVATRAAMLGAVVGIGQGAAAAARPGKSGDVVARGAGAQAAGRDINNGGDSHGSPARKKHSPRTGSGAGHQQQQHHNQSAVTGGAE